MNTYVNYLFSYVVNQQTSSKNTLYEKSFKSAIIFGEIIGYISNNLAVPIVCINTILNISTIIVFTRPDFKKVPVAFYFICLAVSDSLSSLTLLKDHIICKPVQICNMIMYLNMILQFYTPWVSAIISIDRFLQIKSIRLMKFLSKRKVQFSILFAIMILPLFFIIPYFLNIL